MTVPKYDDLFNPIIEALHKLGGSASIQELEDEVSKILNLSEEDLSTERASSRAECETKNSGGNIY